VDNPRKLAHASLVKSDTQECYTNIEINTVLSRARLEKSDASLYTLLYLGVTEKKLFLDHAIAKYSKTPVSDLDPEVINAIRLGIYQMVFTDRIPDYSAVNESVELAPKRSRSFVNAVLRAFLRGEKKVALPTDRWERLSVLHSVPMELIDLLRRSYGDSVAEEIVSYEDKDRGISLRVNTVKIKTGELCGILTERGIDHRVSEYGEGVVKCTCPVQEIKDLIDTGLVFVQDESSYICARTLGAQPGQRVADTCACPGGKTFSMAIDMENKGTLCAYDLHKNKLSLVEKGAKRLGLDIISVDEADGRVFSPENEGRFDRVLCDVPCSGLGVIFKKPDIKYKSIDKINALPQIQLDILKNCSRYVSVGGVLVYSTCTLCREENEINIERFLKENENFSPVDFELGSVKSQGGTYTFFPHITGTDGFFVAKLKRVK
jgi:16S rRNA (cytosine967-C5)-methyltransferase